MSLVDVTSCLLDSIELCSLAWLMVVTQVNSNSSIILASNCSAISNINNVQIVIESHYKVGTTAGLAALHLLSSLVLSIHLAHVVVVCDSATLGDSRRHVVREVGLHYDVVVEVLF